MSPTTRSQSSPGWREGIETYLREEHRLGDDLAVVSGSGTWKKASGEEMMRFGFTYTLRRSGQTWRIVVAAIHDPETPA